MIDNPLFDFVVDKTAQTVTITRDFDAEVELVWDAFTKNEYLDQWWAPKPFESRTKHMDFIVGGRRFYAMVSPQGDERWAVQRYTSITPKTNFKFHNAFTDKDENPDPVGSEWDLNFMEDGESTKVRIVIYNESLERMEMVMAGFREGMKATLGSLTELLATLKTK